MTASLVDLRAFLALLRRERELVEIDAEVDPDLEAAEVHRRVIAGGGPALLFRRVKGSPWPAVTNLFGTARRVELAFGKRPVELVQRLASLPHTLLPPSLGKAWQHRDVIGSLLKSSAPSAARTRSLRVAGTGVAVCTAATSFIWLTVPLISMSSPGA